MSWLERKEVTAVISFLSLILFVSIGIWQVKPPAVKPASVPANQFSAERAMQHLPQLAFAPHPMGSANHQQVRNYLVQTLTDLGLTPERQTEIILAPQPELPHLGGTIHNVMGRLAGTGDGSAILLVAHYDTLPISSGASDNGAAVATLLETIRAVQENEPLTNDLIFLFTDGEELTGLGAQAFMERHAWADDVVLAFNFDARGNQGPSMLFETTPNNRWLIQGFAQAVEHPVASSLAYEVYQLLPNYTDFTLIREQETIAGLNFAFFAGVQQYDSPLDTIDRMHPASLQHHGEYALGLAQHFGVMDLSAERPSGDAIYFNVLTLFLVRYAEGWAIPLAIFVSLGYIALVIRGVRKKQLHPKQLAGNLGALLALLIVTFISVSLMWGAIQTQHPEFNYLRDAYNSGIYLGAIMLLVTALTALYHVWVRKRTGLENQITAVLFVWLLLTLLTSFSLTGASYLFFFPTLFGLIYLSLRLLAPNWQGHFGAWLLLSAGIIWLMVPTLYQILTALGLSMADEMSILMTLTALLLLPTFEGLFSVGEKWWVIGLFAGTAVWVTIGLAQNTTSTEQPTLNHLFYTLNSDTNSAQWVTIDNQVDSWTSQFLGDNPTFDTLADIPFISADAQFLQADAPIDPNATPPKLTILSDTQEGEMRIIDFQMASTRQAPLIILSINGTLPALQLSIGNQSQHINKSDNDPLILFYWGEPSQPINGQITLESQESIDLQLTDIIFELPNITESSTTRPDTMIASPFLIQNASLVHNPITIEALTP